jgi:hypothetical protein
MTISRKNPLYRFAYLLDWKEPTEKTLVGFSLDIVLTIVKLPILSLFIIIISPVIFILAMRKLMIKKLDQLFTWLIADQRLIQLCQRFSRKIKSACVPLKFTE